jgi:aspartate carbamoyltransferase regulatory subunit
VKQQIREQVLKLANMKMLKHFYPTFVSKNLKVSYELVEEVLDEMVKEGLIQRKYQLICPNDNCLRELDVVDDKNDFIVNYMCPYCGEEIEEVDFHYIHEIYSGKK